MVDLFLMRHAKSSWDDAFLDDFERPLNKRGRQAVPLIGQWMIEHAISPELVLCSTAKRCTSTLKLLKEEGIRFADISYHEVLYHASSVDLLSLIRTLPDTLKSLMIIGHNPGMHILANALIKLKDGQPAPPFEVKYPTSAVTHFQFQVKDWSAVAEGSGTLYRYVTPKQLLKAQSQDRTV